MEKIVIERVRRENENTQTTLASLLNKFGYIS